MFTRKYIELKIALALLVCALALFAMPSSSHASTRAPDPSKLPQWSIPHTLLGSGCVSDWYVSYSGTTSWTLINTDPDGLAITDLYFSRSYNDPTDLSHGYLDFNGDFISDIFSAVPIGNGYYRWRYSSGGTSPWINLAYDTTSPTQLRFGDFDGNGHTDVFSAAPISASILYQWKYSPGGVNSYVNLAQDYTSPDQLRFGDFNGDGRTDVFTLRDIGGGYLGWNVSYSGTTNFVQINSAPTPLSEMQFGDINGDGRTDVFTTISNTMFGEWEWFYSSGGTGAYQSMLLTNLGVHDVLLAGDFNGDHRTDMFYTYPRNDGTFQWAYYYFLSGGGVGSSLLAYDATPPDQLRFGQFSKSGFTDVFKLVRRCGLYLPMIRR